MGAKHAVLAIAKNAINAQAGRLTIWSPVLLVFGIWIYFAQNQEPNWALCSMLVLVGAALVFIARQNPIPILIALVIAGFVLAKIRTEFVHTPLLRSSISDAVVVGYVADLQGAQSRRKTVILDVASALGVPADERPLRLRIGLNSKQITPNIGDKISFTASLQPLPTPVMPGGFDSARQSFYQSIGGSGRAFGEVKIITENLQKKYWIGRLFHNLRTEMGAKIRAGLPGELGSFADALITGERSAIPKAMNDSLQTSGLAHILSISGLHMTLVAGGAFWFVRALLALSPRLAQNYPIKKWAAVAALLVGLFYMLLANSGAATERSYIMIAVIFFSILVDRPAISVRNLAIAALLILVFQPEQAIAASFQMSFFAVMGLAAFFEYWNRKAGERELRFLSPLTRNTMKIWRMVWLSVVTSIIAGGLSSIPASFHFGRMSPLSVLANGLALPLMGIIVMPAASLSALLMPIGLEAVPLQILGYGLDGVMWVSDTVAGWPGARYVVPQQSVLGAIGLSFGAAVLCLARGKMRLAGIVIMVAGLSLSQRNMFPDVLIERSGANVAIRNDHGELVPADARKGRYAIGRWLTANGEDISQFKAAKREGWSCSPALCTAIVKGKRIAYLRENNDVKINCPEADILIAAAPLRGACKTIQTRIDRFDVWRSGVHSIFIVGDKVTIEKARNAQGNRPWVFTPKARIRVVPISKP
jgi:competence protein ComEC